MVSSLFTSFTNILSSSQNEKAENESAEGTATGTTNPPHVTDSVASPTRPSTSPTQRRMRSKLGNGNLKNNSRPVTTVPSVHRKRPSSAGRHFISAETLDKAIVQRLQSRGSDILKPDKKEESSPENNDGAQDSPHSTDSGTFSYKDAYLDSLRQEETDVFRDTPSSTSSRAANRQFLSTNHSVPVAPRFNLENLEGLEIPEEEEGMDAVSGEPSVTNSTSGHASMKPGEHRSLVFKNRQFNLENSSREALCSDSHKSLSDMDVTNSPSVNPAVFGAPSLYRQSQLAKSKESIRGESNREGIKRRSRSKSPGPGGSVGFSPSFTSSLGEHLFESTMNDIIENGGEDFKKKYATWVWEAFRTHLVKMKGLLLAEFNQKMQATLEEREQEVSDLQKQYRGKLSQFEQSTEGFQRMIDNLYKENQRVLQAKDFLIDKMKKEFIQCKKHFETDLLRQMQSYRKEAEVEKLELQKRNDELMMIMLTDSSKSGLQDSFKREIDSLHKMIKALTTQNEVLHQQLDEATNSGTNLERKSMGIFQTQVEQARVEMTELRKRLQHAEREREDMTVAHHQEIAKLNRKIQESNTHYDHQLRDTLEEMEALRKKYQKDTRDLKQKISHQETQHVQMISHVKNQYGGQVEELSKVVSQLQTELTMAGNGTNMNSSSRKH